MKNANKNLSELLPEEFAVVVFVCNKCNINHTDSRQFARMYARLRRAEQDAEQSNIGFKLILN